MVENKQLTYLVAVSGGSDSMALLHYYAVVLQQPVAVVHVNYQLSSFADKATNVVTTFCAKHNIPCYVKTCQPQEITKKNQNTYRVIRYQFFNKIAVKTNCYNLLVAHHLDDFVENLWLFANRTKNYQGILKTSQIQNVIIYRPFLAKSKQALQKYCHKNKIAYVEDVTNKMLIYQRNIVRPKVQKLSYVHKKALYYYHLFANYCKQKQTARLLTQFNTWQQTGFTKAYLCEQKNVKNQPKLFYYWFLHNNLKPSQNKIELLQQFVKNHHQTHKILRLKHNCGATIQNGCLRLVFLS